MQTKTPARESKDFKAWTAVHWLKRDHDGIGKVNFDKYH